MLPLQVEYFRRYQLAVQMRYYKGRSTQHRRAARRHTVIILSAVFVAAVISGLFRIPNFASNLPDGIKIGEVVAFFGIALPVLFQAQESIMLMLGDRRNALRYDITFDNLHHIWQDLEKVRARAAEGDRDYFVACEE